MVYFMSLNELYLNILSPLTDFDGIWCITMCTFHSLKFSLWPTLLKGQIHCWIYVAKYSPRI